MTVLLECPPPFICLVRHGETPFSVARRYNGRGDAPLTTAGEKAARELAPALSEIVWTTVLSSDLSRARRTAALAGFPEREVLPELRECDYGDYEGQTTDEIYARAPGWDFWRDGCPNGEDAAGVASRLKPVASRLLAQHGTVLVFSHSHAIRILAAILLGLEPGYGAIFGLEPARVNVIRIHRGRPEIALWNAKARTAPMVGPALSQLRVD